MMNGIQFQSVQTSNALSSELRSMIRDNVLQFYVQSNGMDAQEEGITALYECLSQEDKLDGESNSIANQPSLPPLFNAVRSIRFISNTQH